MLTLGLDSGTQSTKATVFDTDTGTILASASQAYGLIAGLPPGHLEQHPETWIGAADTTISAVLAQIGARRAEVKAIAVSGQQHGLVVLGDDDEPLRPAKLWCDTSTQAQCDQIEAKFGGAEELIRLTGNRMLPGYTAPKLLWLKENEPQNFRSLDCLLLPHDYLNFWLSGEKTMEYGDASGTGLLDIRRRTWFQPLLDFIGDDLADHLPEPTSSHQAIGLLRESLRTEWGLPPNVVIASGSGDNMMGAIGTGNIAPGVVTVSLGTSGTLYAFSATPVADAGGDVAGFCDATDHWLPLVCTMNVTVATEQVRHLFGWDHAAMAEAISRTPAGARGLLFLPYLNGERTPSLPRGCGVLHGLTTANYHPSEIARATMEGVTLGLAYGLDRMKRLGLAPTEIRLTGGGSQSAVWRQIAADIFGVPVVALVSSEGAALGAAIQAAWVWETVQGQPSSLASLTDRWVKLDESTRAHPNPANAATYAEAGRRQTDLTRKLQAGGYL